LSGTVLSIASLQLYSTIDSQDNPSACWCAYFFTSEGEDDRPLCRTPPLRSPLLPYLHHLGRHRGRPTRDSVKELACLVVLLLGCSSLFGQTYDVITGSTFTDGGGNPLANGSIVFLPVLNTGNPLNAKIGGGGQMLPRPVTCLIVNGSITTQRSGATCKLVDTGNSNPANFCYNATVTDTVAQTTFPPYPCMQPQALATSWCTTVSGATTCDMDNYVPPYPALALVTAGPPGPTGPAGPFGANPSKFNGEFLVDGTIYTSLNAAWSAALSAANSTGADQTIRLGVGTYLASSTLYEPTNGACISLIGSAGTTQQISAGTPPGISSTVIVPTSWGGGDLFSLQNASNTQAQSCYFADFTVAGLGGIGGGITGSAFNFQWFRGLTIENVTINDTGDNAIILGEASGSHQSNFYLRNVVLSYAYNGGAGYAPSTRPAFGLQLLPTAIDGNVDTLFCRNALTACVGTQGTGTQFSKIHGFGYPYACTTGPCNNHETNWGAADASWASDYVLYDTGGSNTYTDTYMDSPAIAAFYIGANGISINGSLLFWPDQVTFPHANLASVASTVTSGLVISNVNCTNMSTSAGAPSSPAGASGVWISYFATAGTAPSYSSVSNLAGCGAYVQQRIAAVQTAFDISGNNSANTNFGSDGVVPKVFVTPLSTSAAQGGVEVENFAGGNGDTFYSGFTSHASNFAVRANRQREDGRLADGGGELNGSDHAHGR
jgi:hypothetical protein